MSIGSTACQQRALAALGYLGGLPAYYLVPRLRPTPFREHHFRQAVAIHCLLFMILGLSVVTIAVLSYLLVFHREFYERLQMEGYVLGTLRKLYLAWAVFWGFGLSMAVFGSARDMPLVHVLARNKRLVNMTSLCLVGLYGAILAMIPVTIHATTLVPVERTTGSVYMVYEDNGIFPRWLFALAFYPMALTTESVIGPGEAVLLHISRESVAEALAGGRIVFIGSHGTKKGLMLKDDWLLPEDLAEVPKNAKLGFVYLTGCDSGEQREAWVSALAPAEVLTYDRLSAVLEHAWWLWFSGPERIRRLKMETVDVR